MLPPAPGHARFMQVDVFTTRGFAGNPVAVVLDADGLDTHAMQRIAHWTNLSETTFVLPPTQPGADYRLRIFTPRQELPFAGHPSVGSAHALLDAGSLPADATGCVQECGAGLLPLRFDWVDGVRQIAVRAPAARFLPVVRDDLDRLAAALGATPAINPPPQVVDNGPHWWLAELADETTLRELRPAFATLASLCIARNVVGVAVFARCPEQDYALAVRCFCPADSIPEDPVTGSANACIAAWLHRHGTLPSTRYRVSQGRELGRDGRLELRVEGNDVWVGGSSVTVISGSIAL